MVVSGLQKVCHGDIQPHELVSHSFKAGTTTQVCIFCALQLRALRLRRTCQWRWLRTTSNPQKPYDGSANIYERENSQLPQRVHWAYRPNDHNHNQARPNSRNNDATRSDLETLFRTSTRSLRPSGVVASNATQPVQPGSNGTYSRRLNLGQNGTYSRRLNLGPSSGQGTQAQSQARSRNQIPNQERLRTDEDYTHWQSAQRLSRRVVQPEEAASQWSQLPRKVIPQTSTKDSDSQRQSTQALRHDFVSLAGPPKRVDNHEEKRPSTSPQGPKAGVQPRQGAEPSPQGSEEQEPFSDVSLLNDEGDLPTQPARTKLDKEPSRRSRYEALLNGGNLEDTEFSRKKTQRKSSRQFHQSDEDTSGKNRLYEEDQDRESARQQKMARKRLRKLEKALEKTKSASNRMILPEFISIGNLAMALKVRVEDFSDRLTDLGFEDFGNDYVVDGETAGLIAQEFGFDPIIPGRSSEDDLIALPPPDNTALLISRPPIVTIMGHVDHGKTTLLDWLRQSSVAASEHGGITQHIGAFTVPMPSGRIITFLDTPGHAAFLDMRARGANVTDIVILVVAADDSVKPQTLEAIKHAKAAKVPIIVAINKMDKEEADAQRVKQDLARHGIEVEDFGGDTQTVCVSGKTGMGMEELEESVIALADILDVKADTSGQVEGWVIEATSKKSGKVATILVRRGTLSVGDVLVAGRTWSRVRTLRNEAGILVECATPGTPVEVDGWREQPEAGAEVLQASDEQRARRAVDVRIERADTEKLAEDIIAINKARRERGAQRERERALEKGAIEDQKNGFEANEDQLTASGPGFTEVPFVLRADVSGSVEALQASVLALGNSEVRPTILRSSFGPLNPTDVELAATAGGHVISFNMPVDGSIKRMAESSGVKILDENIIYRLTDEVKTVLEDKLPPLITSRVTGEAEILQVFDITVKGKRKMPVAGCKVRNGTMTKGSKVKVFDDKLLLYDGTSISLSKDFEALTVVLQVS